MIFSSTIFLTFSFSPFFSSGKGHARALWFPKTQTHESIMLDKVMLYTDYDALAMIVFSKRIHMLLQLLKICATISSNIAFSEFSLGSIYGTFSRHILILSIFSAMFSNLCIFIPLHLFVLHSGWFFFFFLQHRK